MLFSKLEIFLHIIKFHALNKIQNQLLVKLLFESSNRINGITEIEIPNF